ncbi:WXG100 family type VII secretion target [Brachybacterium sp. ACRRE]|uniref:WXG100 family type VII secretion target n=1 Tax=Brachybacterium sp. ACRRE TaxID=2918184 RepID=UPI001EF377B1|nr:WXG100 family type VII secretion target [Brachybacterium sp. ACRRE]MCG7311223.1 WXG100 family type VII secretion target [Brachybacterium sp. ACRRE]
MSGFCGMDTAQVRDHAEHLRGAADRLEAWQVHLDAAVTGAAWSGPDAEAFRSLWALLSLDAFRSATAALASRGEQAAAQADDQDAASTAQGSGGGAGGSEPGALGVCAPDASDPVSGIPDAPSSDMHQGYLRDDNPVIPDWLEHPGEQLLSGTAHSVSDAVGRSWDSGLDALELGLDRSGRRSDAIGQLRRDGDRFGGILEDWAAGERAPTYAELGASGVVALGSAGAVTSEAVSDDDQDTAFLDDRLGGIVSDVRVDDAPSASPRDLGDLLIGNDSLRMKGRGADSSGALATGQIGVQEVRSTSGGDPVYIVQVPPTEGPDVLDASGAYGQTGNSRDWGSNLRLVAGQDPAAMDDVRAAMTAADVPAGADVMLVGHSQGGIITSHLAADPSFNSTCGAEGTFNVTHSFSAGSPVQTVIPSQDSTQVVNVAHGPVGLDPHLSLGTSHRADLEYTGDPIAELDLQGAQMGGGTLSAPNVHEVMLPGSTQHASDGVRGIEANHESFESGSPDAYYYGSIQEHTASDPVLSALQGDLDGRYIGEGTYVSRSTVVDVGRGEP